MNLTPFDLFFVILLAIHASNGEWSKFGIWFIGYLVYTIIISTIKVLTGQNENLT